MPHRPLLPGAVRSTGPAMNSHASLVLHPASLIRVPLCSRQRCNATPNEQRSLFEGRLRPRRALAAPKARQAAREGVCALPSETARREVLGEQPLFIRAVVAGRRGVAEIGKPVAEAAPELPVGAVRRTGRACTTSLG